MNTKQLLLTILCLTSTQTQPFGKIVHTAVAAGIGASVAIAVERKEQITNTLADYFNKLNTHYKTKKNLLESKNKQPENTTDSTAVLQNNPENN